MEAVAELNPPALTLLNEMFEKTTHYGRSNFILYNGSPFSWSKSKTFFDRACHAELQTNVDSDTWDHLITWVPVFDPLSLDYLRWLISGPFREYQDLITLENLGDNYFLRCQHLDKWPSNVIYSFCIASRIPIEYPLAITRWVKYKDLGVDPGLAFIAATDSSNPSWNHKLSGSNAGHPNTNHMWFAPTVNYKTILTGETDKAEVSPLSYKASPKTCRPGDVIWGVRDRADMTFAGQTVKDISKLMGYPTCKDKAYVEA